MKKENLSVQKSKIENCIETRVKELYEVFYINVTPFLEITDDFVVLDEAIHPNINIDGK